MPMSDFGGRKPSKDPPSRPKGKNQLKENAESRKKKSPVQIIKRQKLRRLVVSAKQSKVRARQNHAPRPKVMYRRTFVLRPCVIRLAFLVPLAMLALERYLDRIFSLEDVREVYQDQMGIDTELYIPDVHQPEDIVNLTYTGVVKCPPGQRRMMMAHNPQFNKLDGRIIPGIVHQASKTRCLTRSFDRASLQWALRKSSYYIHDENAVKRLVSSNFPEFPRLNLLASECLPQSLLFGLWKFLVLWTYGGIVADLNSYPNAFNMSSIQPDDEGFFLLEEETERLSTVVMAASPGHPLMYYAVQRSLSNILQMQNNIEYDPQRIVGSQALDGAMKDFRQRQANNMGGAEIKLIEGRLVGKQGRSIRIAGRMGDNDGSIVTPIFISTLGKRDAFEKIGMKDFYEPIAGSNCLSQRIKNMNGISG